MKPDSTLSFPDLFLLGLVALAFLYVACCMFLRIWREHRRGLTHGRAGNLLEGEWHFLNKSADAAFAAPASVSTNRFLIVKKGSDEDHIALVTSAADEPLGVCYDGPDAASVAAGQPFKVVMPGCSDKTVKMVNYAGGTASFGNPLFSTGDGTVTPGVPAVAGAYWYMGTAAQDAAAGDALAVIAVKPRKVVVEAKMTCVTTTNASDLASAITLVNAIKADLIAQRTAQAAPAELVQL